MKRFSCLFFLLFTIQIHIKADTAENKGDLKLEPGIATDLGNTASNDNDALAPEKSDTTDKITTASPVDANDPANKDLDEDIRDIRPLVKLPYSWKALLCGILGILLVLLLLMYFYKKHKAKQRLKAIEPPDPYTEAMKAIEQSKRYIREQSPKIFSHLLTDAVRQYLATVFQLPAPESTTEEVILCMRDVHFFDDNFQASIADFLQACDIAKFTQQALDYDARSQLYEQAKQIINYAEKIHQSQTSNTVKTQ